MNDNYNNDNYNNDKAPIENFGAILSRERKNNNLSLRDLQEKLGVDEEGKPNVTSSYLNRIENNEKSNPSFKVVCLLISALSLDLEEVFRAFGFDDIIVSNLNNDRDNIEDILRLSRIRIPLIPSNDGEQDYLSQEQKEYVIELINIAFNYAVCNSDDIGFYLLRFIGILEMLRLDMKDVSTHKFKVLDHSFIINIEKQIRIKLKKLNISLDKIFSIIENLGEKILSESDEFVIRSRELNIVIFCRKSDKAIYVNSIIENYIEIE